MVSGGTDRAQMVGLVDRYQNDASISVIFTVGGLSILVGVVLLAVGLYGKTLMNQNGAPIRLVVPWK